jgi:hypothetical protein
MQNFPIDLTKIKFQSYCWSFGTTSFRVKELNYKNELLLIYLTKFKKRFSDWNSTTQAEFYEFLKEHEFLTGNAADKAKDARQKTSGLHDLGLVYADRSLSPVGQMILENLNSEKFSIDNDFGIATDSYIYLLQLLKFTATIENSEVSLISSNFKPFIRLIHLLCHFDYLTQAEFTYLVPLLHYNNAENQLIADIQTLRNHEKTIDEILLGVIWSMTNYQEAFKYFQNQNAITLNDISIINMSRKGTSYDGQIFNIYNKIHEIVNSKSNDNALELWEISDKNWRMYLFKPETKVNNLRKGNATQFLSPTLDNLNSENEIKKFFFETNHLIRWKKNLNDYRDLNTRYVKLADIISFKDNNLTLDLFAKVYFKLAFLGLDEKSAFNNELLSGENLYKFIELKDLLVNPPKITEVLARLKTDYGIELKNRAEVQEYFEDERIKKFNALIDEKFTIENIIDFLSKFESRGASDRKIKEAITDEATIPTLFEYVIGIAWYVLSDRKVNILESLNLSLDIDLLPKSHASGGQADIVYKYEQGQAIPKHTLLIEATLSDSTTQRRMELEPVSRHLFNTIKESDNLADYAILVSTTIHHSIISDFRGRKNQETSLDGEFFVDGLKILPIDTNMIKSMLHNKLNYDRIYQIFEDAHQSELTLKNGWYKTTLQDKFPF